MTLRECELGISREFDQRGLAQSAFEARRLLCAVLGLTELERLTQQTRELTETENVKIDEWIRRRADGEPLAYLEGQKGFYKSEFLLEPGVLVPRPETEHVVETALRRKATAKKIADLGAGTGCIGLSLLLELPSADLWAVDASAPAVELTQKNARRLGLSDRTRVELSKVESWSPETMFDLIVANPPYIPNDDPAVQPSVHKYEPHDALYAGVDGLDCWRAWSAWAYSHLHAEGIFVGEFGSGQAEAVRAIMENAGFSAIELAPDLAGHLRVVSGIKR